MPSVCLCATEVRAFYGLRLPVPEVGGVRSLFFLRLEAPTAKANKKITSRPII